MSEEDKAKRILTKTGYTTELEKHEVYFYIEKILQENQQLKEYKNLIGKYLNGYEIVKVEKDPFIKGQINLWTNEERIETFGDRSITKFFVRDENNSARIYQELVDKEKYELQQKINRIMEIIELNQYSYGYQIKNEILDKVGK